MTPQVTVLMPTYNGAKHLAATIDSVLAQTFADFEFLIINDASPDSGATRSIVNRFDDSRIRYIELDKNLGIAAASNRGLALARGKYIARQDHDDLSHPNRLQRQIDHMEKHPEVGVCGTWAIYFNEGGRSKRKSYPVSSAEIKAQLFNRCTILHPSAVIRKSLLDEHQIQYNTDYATGNDLRLWLDCMPITEFHNIPEYLFSYRLHNQRASRTKKTSASQEARALFQSKLKGIGFELAEQYQDLFYHGVLKNRREALSLAELRQVELLLHDIMRANEQSGYFPKAEFREELGLLWHRRCMTFIQKNWRSPRSVYRDATMRHFHRRYRYYTALRWLMRLLPSANNPS